MKWPVQLFSIFILASCASIITDRQEFVPPSNQSEAATTHLAVLARTPFNDEVIEALSPDFEIDGAKAFEQSVPLTGLFVDLLRREIRAAVSIKAIPSGDPEVADPETPEPPEPDAAEAPDADDISASDPFTRYSTANALVQEVENLNNYLRSIPKISGHTPYLVRLQLSVIPKRRNLPYDVFSDLSVFADTSNVAQSFLAQRARTDGGITGEQVLVPALPLFATENIERGLDRRSRELLRSVAASATGAIGNVSLGGTGSAAQEQSVGGVANDFNGLFTIGSVTSNVLRVRLGAAQNAANTFEMIPRTHNITLLLLIPDNARVVSIKATQTMRHVLTGEPLERGSGGKRFLSDLRGIVRRLRVRSISFENVTRGSVDDLCAFNHRPGSGIIRSIEDPDEAKAIDFVRKRLRGDLVRGDFETFKLRVQHCFERNRRKGPDGTPIWEPLIDFEAAVAAVEMWQQLASVQAELPDSFVSFEVPKDLLVEKKWE
ncbi:MAG: hypothetical protein AAF557_08110 [Pseudomonadota bacterium]